MEVTPHQLLDIFKAAYRLGEATKTYKSNPLVVASDAEIEADAIPIMGNILRTEVCIFHPRQGGKTKQLKLAMGVPTPGEQRAIVRHFILDRLKKL